MLDTSPNHQVRLEVSLDGLHDKMNGHPTQNPADIVSPSPPLLPSSPSFHDEMITVTLLSGIFPSDRHAARRNSSAPESDLLQLTFRNSGRSSCSSS